jgi:hypothetical protein
VNPYTKLGEFPPGDEIVYVDPAAVESIEFGEWLLSGTGKKHRGVRVIMASMSQHYLAEDPTVIAEEVKAAKALRYPPPARARTKRGGEEASES